MSRTVFYGAVIAFSVIDFIAYSLAKWPARGANFLYKLPGGGIAAYFIVGRKREANRRGRISAKTGRSIQSAGMRPLMGASLHMRSRLNRTAADPWRSKK